MTKESPFIYDEGLSMYNVSMSIGIGQQIKKIRLKKKLTQKGLAELAGMRQPHISNIESGKRDELLSKSVIERIANALNVNLSIILKYKRRPNAKK